jgi:hypothetical protein
MQVLNRRTFFGSISAVAAATAIVELRAAPSSMPKRRSRACACTHPLILTRFSISPIWW